MGGKQEYASPLRTSTTDELRWFFAQRRDGRRAASSRDQADRKLYRAWRREGASIVDATCSPALADAISRGTGRLEGQVLARHYLHLSSLVGTS
jgi:hypothetical protein